MTRLVAPLVRRGATDPTEDGCRFVPIAPTPSAPACLTGLRARLLARLARDRERRRRRPPSDLIASRPKPAGDRGQAAIQPHIGERLVSDSPGPDAATLAWTDAPLTIAGTEIGGAEAPRPRPPAPKP